MEIYLVIKILHPGEWEEGRYLLHLIFYLDLFYSVSACTQSLVMNFLRFTGY